MAEKPWRPPGYKNPYAKTYRWICIETGDEGEKPHPSHLVYEAGADAMLDALFELARESPTKEFIIDGSEHHIYAKGE